MAYAFVICSPSVLDPWEPEIEALAAAGRAKGYLTYEEMNTAAPELAPSPEMMDRILQAMDAAGLEIIDGGDAVRRERAASRARGDVEPVVAEKDRKPSALELPITTEKIDDPVRMYLTQMGEIPLLTRDQEISLAKKIEVTRKRFRRKVLESDYRARGVRSDILQRGRTRRPAVRPHARVSARPTRSRRTDLQKRMPHNLKTLEKSTLRCEPTSRTSRARARSASERREDARRRDSSSRARKAVHARRRTRDPHAEAAAADEEAGADLARWTSSSELRSPAASSSSGEGRARRTCRRELQRPDASDRRWRPSSACVERVGR